MSSCVPFDTLRYSGRSEGSPKSVYAPFDTELRSYGRNNIAPNVINRRRRRNTLRYYALRLLSSEAPYREGCALRATQHERIGDFSCLRKS